MFPVGRKAVPVAWKAAGGGNLEGYASTFGNVDLGGDLIEPGAFARTIVEDIRGDGIPLLADHAASVGSVLGTIHDAQETREGLTIRAELSSAASVQDVRAKLLERHLRSLSIGYQAVQFRYADNDGQQVRVLEQVKLFEVSVVVFPMNEQARIVTAKTHNQLAARLRMAELEIRTRGGRGQAPRSAGRDSRRQTGIPLRQESWRHGQIER